MRTLHLPDDLGDARVTLPLEQLLTTFDRTFTGEAVLVQRNIRLMDMLGQVEVFLDYLKDTDEDVFRKAVREFNAQNETSKIVVIDGHVKFQQKLPPEEDTSQEEESP